MKIANCTLTVSGCCIAATYVLTVIGAAISFAAGIFNLTYLSYAAGVIIIIIPMLKLFSDQIKSISQRSEKLALYSSGVVQPNYEDEAIAVATNIVDYAVDFNGTAKNII